MFKETIDCIDAGTDYCPCHLAESGECILCSQLQGKSFCDCSNWNGVCIYQEFINNRSKAKKGRDTFNCLVEERSLLEKDLLILKFKAPHKLVIDLVKPGGFLFIRTQEDCIYYDVPISILESDIESNIITIMIEIRGIKTKKLLDIAKGDDITIRAPYWNGVFGLKNIQMQKNNDVLVIARGIGMAPMMPVIKKLYDNKNTVHLLFDKGLFENIHVNDLLDKYSIKPVILNLIDKGELSDIGKTTIKAYCEQNDISLIHIAGADILTFKVIEYLDSLDRKDIKLSCCNNVKMCCGEGVCGSCTARYSGHRVKRLCKAQTNPRNVFEGRRFI